MADRIDVNSIIDPKVKKELISIQNEMKKLVDMTKQLASTSKQLDTELKKGAQTQQQVSNARKTAATNTKKLSDVEKEIEKIEQQHYNILTKMVAERSEENKVLERAKQKRAAENKEIKQTIALEKTEANSIARLTAENKKLISERNKLNTSTKEGQKRIMEINSQLDRNNKTIKENSSALEKQKNNVGNYKSALQGAWRSILAVTGVTLGLQGAMKLFNNVMMSAQKTGDALTHTKNALGGSLKSMFRTMSQGDFTFKTLIENMRDGYTAAKNYSIALDEIGDIMRAVDLRAEENMSKLDELRLKFSETETSTIAERKEALKEYNRINDEILKSRIDAANEIIKAERNRLKEDYNINDEQVALIENFVRNYDKLTKNELINVQKVAESRDKYFSEKNKLDNLSRYEDQKTAERIKSNTEIAKKSYDEQRSKLNESEQAYLDLTNVIDGLVDEQRDQISAALKGIAQANREFLAAKRVATRAAQQIAREEEIAQNALKMASKATYDEITKIVDNYAKDALAVEEKFKNQKIDVFEEISDAEEQELQARIEANKVAIEKIMQYERQLRDLKISAINEGFEFYNAIQQRELENLEAKKEREIALAGESTTARELIETQYASKIAEIKRKQAIADKLQAIFNIGLDTAQAIIGFLANPGGIIGTNLSIAAGVIGGIQLATVLAQPIPKFYKGVENFAGGLATVGEQGAELIETPHGVMLSPDRATTMMLPKGTNVYTKDETKAIIKNSNIDVSELVKEQKLTRKALTNKTEHNTSITDKGMKYVIRKNNQRITFIDKYIRS